ncbi:dUTPase [Microcystis phage MaMV-DC]|uniref:dUTP diphosphatase n=1 Tax=Microcystis phage MaMV-DC TaxID=1357715 RepID=A0A075BS79_9CAUD|nr:dUTPase [Microcystis phage MaMV-DC]AGR48732.1 dUTPase [Microcystis phage MaMV-DC]UWV19837.1 dUTPase [Cyanophage MaMV-DH01]
MKTFVTADRYLPTKNNSRDGGYDLKARVTEEHKYVAERLLKHLSLPKMLERDSELFINGSLIEHIHIEDTLETCLLDEKGFYALLPGQSVRVHTGFYVTSPGLPEETQDKLVEMGIGRLVHIGRIQPRSGLAKYGISVANTPGLDDMETYVGEILVLLENRSRDIHLFGDGARIAQFTIELVADMGDLSKYLVRDEVDLGATARGPRGFGSSGV